MINEGDESSPRPASRSTSCGFAGCIFWPRPEGGPCNIRPYTGIFTLRPNIPVTARGRISRGSINLRSELELLYDLIPLIISFGEEIESMIALEHAEKLRLAFRASQTAMQSGVNVARSRVSRFLAPASRVGIAGVRGGSRIWRSFMLARRFYPSLHIPSGRSTTVEPIVVEDAFDPLIVRSLPRNLHALVRFRVAIRIGAPVRAEQAALLCEREGWRAEQVGAAAAGYDGRMFSEVERLVLRYTDDLTRTPMDVDMSTLRSLRRNLTDDQLMEITASIAQENFKARFQTGVAVSRALSGRGSGNQGGAADEGKITEELQLPGESLVGRF